MHSSRVAAELAVAHEEIYLKRQSLPVPISQAAKSGGPIQSLLLLGGIGALAVLKLVPKAQPALKQFMHDHPIMWSPINTLFSSGGRSLGGSSQVQSQPKAPRGGREAASKAAKAAAQAAAARAATVAPAPVKPAPASSSVKVTLSPSKIPAPPTSATKPSPRPQATNSKTPLPAQSSPSQPQQLSKASSASSAPKKPSLSTKKK